MDYSLFLVVEKNKTFEKKQKIKNELLVKKQERHRNMYLSPNLEELYHVGIIDWLQLWDFNKKSEVLLKVLFKNKEKKGLSARPPQEYSQRFEKYMMENVFQLHEKEINDRIQSTWTALDQNWNYDQY